VFRYNPISYSLVLVLITLFIMYLVTIPTVETILLKKISIK
jgi:hypothetical protein